ncbi:hypothetical protein GmHk_04G010531 [Glycine max]|nr:hypothetical protein GmHk_04G010531 [Glycine max]
MILDASTGGTMMSKSPEEAIVIIDSIVASDYQSHHDRALTQRKGIMKLDTQNAILAQNKLLMQQIEVLIKQIGQLPQQYHQGGPRKTHQAYQVQQILRCDFCGEEDAHYLNNQARPQQKFQGSYQGYKGGLGSNHPYGWRPQNFGPTNTSFVGPSNKSYGGFSNRGPQQQQTQPDRMLKMEDTLTQFMQVSIINQKNIDAFIKNLEVQVGQLTKQLSEHGSGSFSATTQVNPKEHCNLITTRWGTVIGLKDNDEKKNKEGVEKENEKNDEVVASEIVEEKVVSEEQKQKSKKQATNKGKAIINIPFSKALEQMPTYAKFMKDLLMKKKRIMDGEIVKAQPQQ